MKLYMLTEWNPEYGYEEICALSTNKEDLKPFDPEYNSIQEFNLPEDGSLHLRLMSDKFELVDKEGNIVKDGVKLIH